DHAPGAGERCGGAGGAGGTGGKGKANGQEKGLHHGRSDPMRGATHRRRRLMRYHAIASGRHPGKSHAGVKLWYVCNKVNGNRAPQASPKVTLDGSAIRSGAVSATAQSTPTVAPPGI